MPPGGDAHLGGDDWDQLIAKWITDKHLRPAGLDPATDPRLRANLRALAQAAKHSLSGNEEVVLRCGGWWWWTEGVRADW